VAEVTRFIVKYEPQYLDLILGADLSAAYQAAISVNDDLGEGIEPAVIETRWTDLQAKLRDNTNKLSPIASYVYYFIIRDRMTQTAALAETQAKGENSDIVLNTDKMMRAYNDSMRKGKVIYDWVVENETTYPEFDPDHTFEVTTVNVFGI